MVDRHAEQQAASASAVIATAPPRPMAARLRPAQPARECRLAGRAARRHGRGPAGRRRRARRRRPRRGRPGWPSARRRRSMPGAARSRPRAAAALLRGVGLLQSDLPPVLGGALRVRAAASPSPGPRRRVDRRLHARAEVELAQDVLHVDLDRGLGDVERAADLLVAGAARDLRQDLALARRQRVDRVGAVRGRRFVGLHAAGRQRLEGGDQLVGHLRADRRLAAHHAHDRRDQRVAVLRLEQVAARAAAQRRGQVLLVLADGEHQHARLRRRLAQPRQRVDAAHARQVVVEQDHVGLQLGGAALRLAGIGGLADHAQLRLRAQQRDQPAAQQRVVVDHQHADRIVHRSRLRAAGAAARRSGLMPPTAAARAATRARACPHRVPSAARPRRRCAPPARA